MNHNQFGLKTQCYGIFFNSIVLFAQSLMITSLTWLLERYQSGRDLNVFFIFIFFLPLVWFFASTIIAIIAWRIVPHRYILVETLNKESFNFFLSIALCLFVINAFAVIIIYSLGAIDAPELMGSVYAAGICSNLMVLLFTQLIIIYATIQIVRRKIYHYPCIFRPLK